MSEQVCKSFVYHKGNCFLVSSIVRFCSALGFYDLNYTETMAWTYDEATNLRGYLIYQGESYKGDLSRHSKVCQLLADTGKPEEEGVG